jgi:hypothetical protein
MERGVAWLRERVTDRPVLYIAGKYEFYGEDINRTVEKARAVAEGTNIRVLQNDSLVLDGITFLGCTFWTDFDLFGDAEYAMMAAAETMNDYRKIRVGNYIYRLRPLHTLRRHQESRDFLARECGNRNSVRARWSPTWDCIRMRRGAVSSGIPVLPPT